MGIKTPRANTTNLFCCLPQPNCVLVFNTSGSNGSITLNPDRGTGIPQLLTYKQSALSC